MKSKIVLITGNFNVLHTGHLRMFAFAKKFGKKLLVGVNSDKIAGKSAILNEKSRLEMVKNSNLVTKAIILREPISKFIGKVKPSYVVKGKEHENKFNKEKEILKKYGGKLIFSSGESILSSKDLIKKEFDRIKIHQIELPESYMDRHKLSRERLVEIVKKFKDIKVLVIGDLILDEYVTCQPLGMSQEDSSIVVNSIDNEFFLGGAGIVSAHAAGLGANSSLISVVGKDKYLGIIKKKLKLGKVTNNLVSEQNRQSICKKRFRSENQVLFRLSELTRSSISLSTQQKILNECKKNIKKTDLVIFSDFNYGTLNQNLVNKIISICKKNKVMMAADSQSSSQLGDIARFKGMDLITPTEYEARISTKNYDDGLVTMIDKLRDLSKARNIILKLGPDGSLIHTKMIKKNDFITDRIRSLNSSPKDVVGAGDAMLTASTLALKSGANIWEASLIGSISAAIQVGIKGNTPLKLSEILNILEN
jgi:rfaE bifunctional protein kinase chain/domain